MTAEKSKRKEGVVIYNGPPAKIVNREGLVIRNGPPEEGEGKEEKGEKGERVEKEKEGGGDSKRPRYFPFREISRPPP